MSAGVTLVLARLRAPSAAVALGLAFLAVVATALVERGQLQELAFHQTLLGAVLGLAVPLCCFGLAELASAGGRLTDSLWVLARHGQNRRTLLAGVLAALAGAGSVLGLLLACVAVAVSGPGSTPWLPGLLAGALTGVIYGLWFALGSLWGTRGQGRFWLLLLDWMLGGGGASLAFWPRAHVRELVTAEPHVAVVAWASVVALSVLYASVVLLRARP